LNFDVKEKFVIGRKLIHFDSKL